MTMPDFDVYQTPKLLKELSLNLETVCYELTEHYSFEDENLLQKTLKLYKENGFCIAIDDFGTGVSGLHLLYISETNFIKIDKFFIRDIDKDSRKKLFCTSIVEMAHIMGIKVIAEGVETIGEYYVCKELKIDYLQGYLIAKPTLETKEIKKVYSNIKNLHKRDKRLTHGNLIDKSFIDKIDALNINSSLHELFMYFKEHTTNTFVPIIDDNKKIVGAIYEVDIKQISYSQYGLSLAKNNSYKEKLKTYIKPIVEIDIKWGIDKALEIFNMQNDAKGIFVTKDCKYYGFINLNSLLSLSYKRNIEIAQNQNPLTKLPGNDQIDDFITTSFSKKLNTHMVYFDFNDFKPFNDLYGFRQGDRAILMFSEILRKSLATEDFIAHVGGDDFFVGFVNKSFNEVYNKIWQIQKDFKINVSSLYNEKDITNQYITSIDRFGQKRKFELLSVSVALIETSKKSTLKNFNKCLGEIKKQSKETSYPMGVCIPL